MSEQQLEQFREQIDQLDQKLLATLSKRADLARQIGDIKMAEEPGHEDGMRRPEREEQVLQQVAAANPGPLPDQAVRSVFREIMDVCLALEEPPRVACLGPAGTYSEHAVQSYFTTAVRIVSESTISAVFASLDVGIANYALVPVSSSTESLSRTAEELLQTKASICGEIDMDVRPDLLATDSGGDVRCIYADRHDIVRCRKWLDANYAGVERSVMPSSAAAAARAAEEPGSAAICGQRAAQIYGLQTLSEGIADARAHNMRFVILAGHDAEKSTGSDKTSIIIEIPVHSPGILSQCMQRFASADITVARIEHHGRKCFIDFLGHRKDPEVMETMRSLASVGDIRLLGSYPRHTPAAKTSP